MDAEHLQSQFSELQRTNKHFTVLCQQNGGCMGCCGHDFMSRDKITEAIRLNTQELAQANPENREQFIAFRDRASSGDLRFGVCRNLVRLEFGIGCPLHPARHSGEDLREGHCDIHYLCDTAKAFGTWGIDKQEEFLKFVAGRKLDNITYSILMDSGGLLQEFRLKRK
jgi:hypothetical protein